jgi:hypothetical protein
LEQALNEALDKVNQQNKIRAEQCTEVGTDITFRALLLVVVVVVAVAVLLLLFCCCCCCCCVLAIVHVNEHYSRVVRQLSAVCVLFHQAHVLK